uniref:Cytosine-specific methyltransferase n=1 Tax=Bacillus sp. M(2010) TaxID=932685 RepID=E5Q8T8_9BACI|nr:M1.BspMI [Bacillus sp. M(2010)]
MQLLVVDLFSGAGGLHIGFEKAGFEIGLCIDNDINVEKTHKYNFPNIPFMNVDIKELSSDQVRNIIGNREVDVLIGGPPCQGFSTIGKRVSSNLEKRSSPDPRNGLIFQYIRLLKDLKPKYLVMENVKGLLTMNGGGDLANAINLIQELGYNVAYKVLNMADYGVPQIRERVIIIGNRLGEEIDFPEKDYSELPTGNLKQWNNCWNAIKDLVNKEYSASFNHVPLKHTDKIIERYKLIPEGGRLPEDKLPPELFRKNFGNTYKRLSRERPALTMVPGNDAFPIHPILHRSLTVREAARIQTFPDSMFFLGNRRQTGHQVGNAVPPLFSNKLACHIKRKLEVKTNAYSS